MELFNPVCKNFKRKQETYKKKIRNNDIINKFKIKKFKIKKFKAPPGLTFLQKLSRPESGGRENVWDVAWGVWVKNAFVC